MAHLSCAICLDQLKFPVVTPCGHIHCKKCLQDHIKSGTDAVQSTCPTCRASFYIVTPNLDYVPEKLHPFIMSSVRRIYLDVDSDNTSAPSRSASPAFLSQRIAELESRNSYLEGKARTQTRDISLLMERCESNMNAARVIGERERSTRIENEKIKAELADYKKKYLGVKIKYNAISRPQTTPSVPAHTIKRKSSQDIFATPGGSSDASFPVDPRPVFRIPKRARLASISPNDPPPRFDKGFRLPADTFFARAQAAQESDGFDVFT